MVILGLTGSIGMGKSTAAKHLAARGIAVFDADACVHELYSGSAVPLIEAAFPGTTANGTVNRAALATRLGASSDAFARLGAIVHPLVRAAERAFLQAEHARGAWVAVLEIPLLYETGADALCDAVMVVSADAAMQRARVLARPGMTPDRLDAILAQQMPDSEKRRRADFIVDTSGPVTDTQAQIDHILAGLHGRGATAYKRHWAE